MAKFPLFNRPSFYNQDSEGVDRFNQSYKNLSIEEIKLYRKSMLNDFILSFTQSGNFNSMVIFP